MEIRVTWKEAEAKHRTKGEKLEKECDGRSNWGYTTIPSIYIVNNFQIIKIPYTQIYFIKKILGLICKFRKFISLIMYWPNSGTLSLIPYPVQITPGI